MTTAVTTLTTTVATAATTAPALLWPGSVMNVALHSLGHMSDSAVSVESRDCMSVRGHWLPQSEVKGYLRLVR